MKIDRILNGKWFNRIIIIVITAGYYALSLVVFCLVEYNWRRLPLVLILLLYAMHLYSQREGLIEIWKKGIIEYGCCSWCKEAGCKPSEYIWEKEDLVVYGDDIICELCFDAVCQMHESAKDD